ncbi:MAG: hypothetical protein K0S42_3243 [Microvirga sp.]|jgi:hypothetical protein|nr:hypothetical protein [Microvirga sp.]
MLDRKIEDLLSEVGSLNEVTLLAHSGQGANFRVGQEHRTFLPVNEFHYLTRPGARSGSHPCSAATPESGGGVAVH